MHNLTFPLLGALSALEITDETPAEKELNKLRDAINANFLPEIRKSAYEAKSGLSRNLDRCLNDARTLCNFPQLLGKTLIGIIASEPSADQVLQKLGKDIQFWNRKTELPHLLTNTGETLKTRVISSLGKPVSLANIEGHSSEAPYELAKEELDALADLTNVGINPRSLCTALHFNVPLAFPNVAFLVLPAEEFGRPDSGKLIAQCDAIFILGPMTNGKSLKIMRDNFNMPIYFLTNADVGNEIGYLKERYAGRTIERCNPNDFEKLVSTLCKPVDRVTLKDRLLAEILLCFVNEDTHSP